MAKQYASEIERKNFCRVCGSEFEGLLEVCDLCRAKEKELNRLRRDKTAKKSQAPKRFRPAADIDVRTMAAIIDRYNERHGTNYSYGRFMQLVYEKKIDIRKEARF